jgi:DNA-binding NtrC family response regulator
MKGRILIVDDEELFCRDLAVLLEDEGYSCATSHTGEVGLEKAREFLPDIVLCDLMLPDMNGVQVVDALGAQNAGTAVIVITAFGTMETAVDAFRHGAIDYLLKPLVLDDLLRKVSRCLEETRLKQEVRYLRRTLTEIGPGTRIIGDSQRMLELKELIDRVAAADSSILIRGETGTGKELVARAIHESSSRSDRPFVAVNSAALPRDLVESELFGHVRGAFTGASQDRPGFFRLADKGTLFLDEIGELPLELQPKLLRALESQEITPVGGGRPVHVDVRILAATHRDLAEEAKAGRFREDLLYRIRVVELTLPALRDRPGDIAVLAEHLLNRVCKRLGRRVLTIDPRAVNALLAAPWRGNVRELENALERAVLLTDSDTIGISDLPPELRGEFSPVADTEALRESVEHFEEQHIRRVLRDCDDNREEAARRLDVDPSTLYRRLKRFDSNQ